MRYFHSFLVIACLLFTPVVGGSFTQNNEGTVYELTGATKGFNNLAFFPAQPVVGSSQDITVRLLESAEEVSVILTFDNGKTKQVFLYPDDSSFLIFSGKYFVEYSSLDKFDVDLISRNGQDKKLLSFSFKHFDRPPWSSDWIVKNNAVLSQIDGILKSQVSGYDVIGVEGKLIVPENISLVIPAKTILAINPDIGRKLDGVIALAQDAHVLGAYSWIREGQDDDGDGYFTNFLFTIRYHYDPTFLNIWTRRALAQPPDCDDQDPQVWRVMQCAQFGGCKPLCVGANGCPLECR